VFWEEYTLGHGFFENGGLRRIFIPEKEEMAGLGKEHKEKTSTLF
jgi:hypothetical protein